MGTDSTPPPKKAPKIGQKEEHKNEPKNAPKNEKKMFPIFNILRKDKKLENEILKNIVEDKKSPEKIKNEPAQTNNEKNRKMKINEYFKATVKEDKKKYAEKKPEKEKDLKRKLSSKEKKQKKEELSKKRKGYWLKLAKNQQEKKSTDHQQNNADKNLISWENNSLIMDNTLVRSDVSLAHNIEQIQCSAEWPNIEPSGQNDAADSIISTDDTATSQDNTCSNPSGK